MMNIFFRTIGMAGFLLLSAGLCFSQQVNTRGMQTVFGEYAAAAQNMETAPEINGEILIDPAWRNVKTHYMPFVDRRIPGLPRDRSEFQVGCDSKNLYVAFNCREIRRNPGGKGRKADDDSILKGSYIGLVLDTGRQKGNRYFLVLSTPYGASFTAARSQEDVGWDKTWEPKGLDVRVMRYVERWTVEIRLPFQDELSGLSTVADINFIRVRGDNAGKDEKYIHAWRQLLDISKDRKKKEILSALKTLDPVQVLKVGKPFFGKLFVPCAGKKPDNMKKLIKASVLKPKTKITKDDTVQPGFEVSVKELNALYGRKSMLVPKADTPPTIDGKPDDPAWKEVPGTMLGYLLEDVPGKETQNPTIVKIITDNEYLYCLAVCKEEEISKINVSSKTAMWKNDVVEILFDAGHHENYTNFFHILANAKGRTDYYRGRSDQTWSPESLDLKGAIGKDYWAVEFRIAFRDFGFKDNKLPKLWGANFCRTRWVNRFGWGVPGFENWDTAWVANSHTVLHVPDKWGQLYLQAGTQVPAKLAKHLEKKGKRLADLNLSLYTPKAPEKVDVPPLPERKAEFKKKPRVKVADGTAAISFEVSELVDATVSILNSEGKVVRHLASGLLGKNAPEPFQAGSLSQKLTWDFTDDVGQKLPKADYTVRVDLGLDIAYEQRLLWTPYQQRGIRALVCGPDGTLYVFNDWSPGPHFRYHRISAYDRNGKYVRTVYPFPGQQKAEDVSGAMPIQLQDGSWIPTVYQGMSHSFIPWNYDLAWQLPVVTPDGRLVFINKGNRELRVPKRLLCVGVDGSVPADMAGPVIVQEEVRGAASIACSPDGKTFYVTALRGQNLWPPRGGEPHHVIYRMKWDDPRMEPNQFYRKPFIGEIMKKGGGKTHLNYPSSVDVDKDGNLIVADSGNSRVVKFSPAGKYISEFHLPGVQVAKISRRTGAIYTLCRAGQKGAIMKFDGMTESPEYQVKLMHPACGLLALDDSKKKARLWTTYDPRGPQGPTEIFQIQDTGKALVNNGDPLKEWNKKFVTQERPLAGWREFFHDPDSQKIYIRSNVFEGALAEYNGLTGVKLHERKMGRSTICFSHIGPLGYFYGISRNSLQRMDSDWKKAKFPNRESHVIRTNLYPSGNGDWSTFCVSPGGIIGVLDVHNGVSLWDVTGRPVVRISNPGKVRKGKKGMETHHIIHSSILGYAHTIRVDSQGGIYLGVTARSRKERLQPEIRGRLPRNIGLNAEPRWHYEHFIGSVLKFKPHPEVRKALETGILKPDRNIPEVKKGSGGTIVSDQGGDMIIGLGTGGYFGCTIKNMDWFRLGFSPRLFRCTENANCHCEQGNFDLDAFDRCYIPNAFLYHVTIVDRNNNIITRTGRYGNMDETAKKGKEPRFGWPMCVSAGDKYLYVGDTEMDCIHRTRLTYRKTAEASFRLKK